LRAAGAQRLRRAFFLLFQIHTPVDFVLRKRFASPFFFSNKCVEKGVRGIHDLFFCFLSQVLSLEHME